MLRMETTIATLIFSSFVRIPQANAQAPVGDFGPTNDRVIQRVDDRPVVHDYRKAPKSAFGSQAVLIYTIHEDMLQCYHSLGRKVEEEAELKWLLAARPGNALLHYNYACLLRSFGRMAEATAEYKMAVPPDYTKQLPQTIQINPAFDALPENMRSNKAHPWSP